MPLPCACNEDAPDTAGDGELKYTHHRSRLPGRRNLLLRGAAAAALLALRFPLSAGTVDLRVLGFINRMASEHGFDRNRLEKLFANFDSNGRVLELIAPAGKGGRRKLSWSDYRDRQVSLRNIMNGIAFARDNADLLARAEQEQGVPLEIITAIIGIETRYGRNTGGFNVFEAVATLALDYPPRSEFFFGELEQLLLYAREQGVDPAELEGSYAGAIGIAQFLPSSAREYAVDFDGDGRVDLFSVADAIGSVANFLRVHGWRTAEPVAFPVVRGADARPSQLLASGILPQLSERDFEAGGFAILTPDNSGYSGPYSLVDLIEDDGIEYYAGTRNFYVLTRYNRSSKYAMAVLELSKEIAARVR